MFCITYEAAPKRLSFMLCYVMFVLAHFISTFKADRSALTPQNVSLQLILTEMKLFFSLVILVSPEENYWT